MCDRLEGYQDTDLASLRKHAVKSGFMCRHRV